MTTETFEANGKNWRVRWTGDDVVQVIAVGAKFVEGEGADFSDWPSDEQVSAALGTQVKFFASSFHPAEQQPVKVYNTIDGITDAQIEALSREAAEAGDLDMVDVCARALAGQVAARARCADAIADARAQED